MKLTTSGRRAVISFRDNGKGIPAELLSKVVERGGTFGKKDGNGLGLSHAKATVESWGGKFKIESTVGKGTTITLELMLADSPLWFAGKVTLLPTTTVIILDDDPGIHGLWEKRLAGLIPKEQVIHFDSSQAILEWFRKNLGIVDNPLYLCDFELIGSKQTGLDVIDILSIAPDAILVTSRADEAELREKCAKRGLRLLPKQLAPFVPVTVEAPKQRYDAILVDDDSLVHMTWQNQAKRAGKLFKGYFDPEVFFKEAATIDTNCPIYVDSSLGNGVKGEELVPRLLALGFKKIFLATGYEPDQFAHVQGLSGVVEKDPAKELMA